MSKMHRVDHKGSTYCSLIIYYSIQHSFIWHCVAVEGGERSVRVGEMMTKYGYREELDGNI